MQQTLLYKVWKVLTLRWGRAPGKPSLAGAFWAQTEDPSGCGAASPARGAGTLIPSAQRLVWAAKQPLGKAALGALFA